jgi:hypothetical protein
VQIMTKQFGEKWRSLWRSTREFLLAMDADPLEDIHRRVRQLETAYSQSESERQAALPAMPVDEVTLQK